MTVEVVNVTYTLEVEAIWGLIHVNSEHWTVQKYTYTQTAFCVNKRKYTQNSLVIILKQFVIKIHLNENRNRVKAMYCNLELCIIKSCVKNNANIWVFNEDKRNLVTMFECLSLIVRISFDWTASPKHWKAWTYH